jgi:glycosyl transferase, family 25
MDGIFVINRVRDTERLQSTKAQLDRFDLGFERIEAIEAAALPEHTVADLVAPRMHRIISRHPDYVRHHDTGIMVFMPEHHRYLVAAEIACYLSHRRAIEALIASQADAGLILEDDVGIHDDLPAVLASARALPPGAHVVKLEGVQPAHRVNLHVARAGARDIVLMLKPTTGAAAYYLTRAAALRLHEAMLPIRSPYDSFLRQYWLHGVEVLEVVPFPVWQLPFPTNIPQRHAQCFAPDFTASQTMALAAATPFLKLARLLRRGAAMARQTHRLGRLRFGLETAAKRSQQT